MEITGYKDKHEYTNKNGVTSVVYLMDCVELLKQVPDNLERQVLAFYLW